LSAGLEDFFLILFIYEREREGERDHEQVEGQREKEKPTLLLSREPDAALDPRTLGS